MLSLEIETDSKWNIQWTSVWWHIPLGLFEFANPPPQSVTSVCLSFFVFCWGLKPNIWSNKVLYNSTVQVWFCFALQILWILKCFNLVSTKRKYCCNASYKYSRLIFVKLTFKVWPFPPSPCEGLSKTSKTGHKYLNYSAIPQHQLF